MIGVHRRGAAGGEQGIVARLLAVLGEVDAGRTGHVLVDDVVDAPGGALGVDTERIGEASHCRLGGREVDLHLATEEEVGIEISQQQVGVGDGGIGAAAAVAGGAGLRAGTLRADLHQAEFVAVGDRAAAGPDFDQLDGRDLDRQAATLHEALLARRLEAVCDQRLAAVDETELRRRTAHVEGEHTLLAGVAAEPGAGEGAGSRPGFQQLDGGALRLLDVGEAAVREHQEEGRLDAEAGDLRHEPVEVDLGERFHEGVRDRGRGTGILADLRRDVAGSRNRQGRMACGDQCRCPLLVHRVGVGVQEDDGEGRDAVSHQRVDLGEQRRLVQRGLDGTIGADALGDLAPQGARDEGGRHLDEDVVELVLPLARDLQDVAEAVRRDQAGLRALALDQRIGEERRGVDDTADVARRDAVAFEDAADAGDDAPRRVVGGGGFLPDRDARAGGVEDDDVGERATDIDAEGELLHGS